MMDNFTGNSFIIHILKTDRLKLLFILHILPTRENCTTYPSFVEYFVSDYTGTREHVISRTRGKTHFLPSWTRVLRRAVVARKFTFWSTGVG